jgi:hypothetical protein
MRKCRHDEFNRVVLDRLVGIAVPKVAAIAGGALMELRVALVAIEWPAKAAGSSSTE